MNQTTTHIAAKKIIKDETNYLNASFINRKHLQKSLRQLKNSEIVKLTLEYL